MMKTVRYIFLVSGIYGIIILVPQLFREQVFAPLTHPEFYYGFFLVTLAFQFLFLLIASDPVKYRQAMLPGMIAKGGYIISCILLFVHGRLAKEMLIASSPDLLMLGLFIYSYSITLPKYEPS
ncbi:hypothetical protein ACFS5N_06165 [Mucilaginibacter ximonensis]|uniref:DoxX-like protein n=1 Tax=Mucilaginibacter ximonensis TaxID=538021 RepID=A0ABW5Y9S8_9SPHI